MSIKRDIGYVRVSTKYDTQRDSPEHQAALIKEVASREGIELKDSDFYEDRDTATSILVRDDVQRLIADAKRGEIRSIWFASLSRFSRDTLDALSLKRILVNALKVRVVSIEDGYDSAKKDDELLFGVKSAVNQNQSEQISAAARRGIDKSAEAGNYIGSIAPYGYRKIVVDDPRMKNGKRKTLEIIPEQAEIVRKIYDMYVNRGMGEKAITIWLNGENGKREPIPSYRGGRWGLTSVQRILQNENYTGYNVYGRHTVEVAYDDLSDLMNRRKKLVMKPKEEWKRTSFQTHEAIISRALFQQAQEVRRMRGGGERGGRRSFVNVFAKMIFCHHCGSAMVTMGSGKKTKYRYLMCSRRRRMGKAGCENGRWIPYYEMRDELIEGIIKRIEKVIRIYESSFYEDVSPKLPNNDFEQKKRKHLKKIEESRKLIMEIRRKNMLGEIDQDQFEFEREQYETEIENSKRRLEVIREEEKRTLDVKKLIRDAKKSFEGLSKLKNYNDIEKTRLLLMPIVKRIEVDKCGLIQVELYLRD